MIHSSPILPHPWTSSPASSLPISCLTLHALVGKGNRLWFLMDVMLFPTSVCLPKLCPLPGTPATAQLALLPLIHPWNFVHTGLIIPHPCPLCIPLSLPPFSSTILTCYVSILPSIKAGTAYFYPRWVNKSMHCFLLGGRWDGGIHKEYIKIIDRKWGLHGLAQVQTSLPITGCVNSDKAFYLYLCGPLFFGP